MSTNIADPICRIDWGLVAAWVQAIGTIVAIWYSGHIARRAIEHSEARSAQDRRRQAEIAAASFAIKLRAAIEECVHRKEKLTIMFSSGALERLRRETRELFLTQFELPIGRLLLSEIPFAYQFDADSGIGAVTVANVFSRESYFVQEEADHLQGRLLTIWRIFCDGTSQC